jgi:hypothetical protein
MTTQIQIPEFIDVILAPRTQKGTGRKVWSLDLETVLIPFFCATNAVQKTAIPSEALGAPLRLQYNKDGTPKFSEKTGKPVIRVADKIREQVNLMRENYQANLLHFVATVRKANPEAYAKEQQQAGIAGEPIRERDRIAIENAVTKAMAEALANQSKPQAETVRA